MRLVSCDPREDGTPMITLECSLDELRDDNITIGMGSITMSTARATRLRDQLCEIFGVPKSALTPNQPLPCEPYRSGLYWTRDHSVLLRKDGDGDWSAVDLDGDGDPIDDFFGDGVTYALCAPESHAGWPVVVQTLGGTAFPLERLEGRSLD